MFSFELPPINHRIFFHWQKTNCTIVAQLGYILLFIVCTTVKQERFESYEIMHGYKSMTIDQYIEFQLYITSKVQSVLRILWVSLAGMTVSYSAIMQDCYSLKDLHRTN